MSMLSAKGRWMPVPGDLYVDSAQIRSVIRVRDPADLETITLALFSVVQANRHSADVATAETGNADNTTG